MDLRTHRVSVHAMYYKIATERAAAYHRLDAELESLNSRPIFADDLAPTERRIEACYEEREQAAVVAITFSAMGLEAFFYDYAAEALGDKYVKDHLDKLDLKSKYLVYPKLICGKQPGKGGETYACLERLVKLRNDLVHFKSKPFELDQLQVAAAFHDSLNVRLKAGVTDCVNTVMLVMRDLDKLHGSGGFFEQRMKWSIE